MEIIAKQLLSKETITSKEINDIIPEKYMDSLEIDIESSFQ